MDYMKKILGIDVIYENADFVHFPNFITARYRLQMVLLDDTRTVFVYPKTELEQIETLKKHIERIHNTEQLPVVLILKKLSFRQKEYLIRARIPFVVERKQIYLPFMSVYLQEKCDADNPMREEIRPSTQMLFLYFIYMGAKDMSTSQAARALSLTPTSISRASRQLEEMGILQAKRIGVQKILFSQDSPKILFYKKESKLINPVKRTVYIDKGLVQPNLMKSGYSALSEYSMLNAPSLNCYATETISKWKNVSTNNLYDSTTQVAVELWRYNPQKLSKQNTVDVLSLALSLKRDSDERVEEAVEEMLNDLWRKIDGYRD